VLPGGRPTGDGAGDRPGGEVAGDVCVQRHHVPRDPRQDPEGRGQPVPALVLQPAPVGRQAG